MARDSMFQRRGLLCLALQVCSLSTTTPLQWPKRHQQLSLSHILTHPNFEAQCFDLSTLGSGLSHVIRMRICIISIEMSSGELRIIVAPLNSKDNIMMSRGALHLCALSASGLFAGHLQQSPQGYQQWEQCGGCSQSF